VVAVAGDELSDHVIEANRKEQQGDVFDFPVAVEKQGSEEQPDLTGPRGLGGDEEENSKSDGQEEEDELPGTKEHEPVAISGSLGLLPTNVWRPRVKPLTTALTH
jgi:hypothetical protein